MRGWSAQIVELSACRTSRPCHRADSSIRPIVSLRLSTLASRLSRSRPWGLWEMSTNRPRVYQEKRLRFPTFLKVAKRRCLVVGAGKTAGEKISSQLGCGAVSGFSAPGFRQTIAIAIDAPLIASNPLDVIPDEIPFDVPYGPPISLDRAHQAVIHAAVAEAKKRNWTMNVAVADSGGNLVAFQRMDGAMLASIQIQNTRCEQPRPSGAQPRSSRMASTLCISTICSRSMESLPIEAGSH
jgi:hypothetical protein